MSRVNYTARRAIATGHNIDNPYTLEILPRALDESHSTVGEKSQALSGPVQHIVSRREKFYTVQTERFALGTQDYENIVEFLESVDMREVFLFDADGTTANPLTYAAATLEGNYTRARVDTTNEFTFSFKVQVF